MTAYIGAEELLLRTKRVIDPFNRIGCNIEPTLTVIEFCQFQGPRALATVSLKPALKRPICVAVLTSKRLTHSQLSRFSNGVRRLVSPLIKCNRRLFLRQLADFMKISDAVGKSLAGSVGLI
ncbi:unnamed protein product [Angiostrongylus costaricensis]|uniref:Pentatricopeptide repeat-containing protein n=1 Tax=Angiostrongylus costaricensis TaxID=334426 RepID=A0A0R3PML4_ANGCS|nr:unnamed protein product [Angiostrongylus costaricensis]